MSKQSNALIQKLLSAEEEAERVIKKARENRVRKLKEAKISAQEEIEVFKQKEESRFQRELQETFGQNDTSAADLDEITLRDIEKVKKDYKANRDKVVSFLTTLTTRVDLAIPEVQRRQLQRDSGLA